MRGPVQLDYLRRLREHLPRSADAPSAEAGAAELLFMNRVTLACARGSLDLAGRRPDPTRPATWEFGAFSQNGEDGLIAELLSRVSSPNRYFVELGASDGLESNSSYLAYVKRYSGLMVEGDPDLWATAQRLLQPLNWGVHYLNQFIEPDDVDRIAAACREDRPDFLSLDIDGVDYYVAEAVLQAGLRPKVVCVEYNSAFGPARPVTIPYSRGFDYRAAHPSRLYYGASVMGWRKLFATWGYDFVSVDTNGVNAFFIDPGEVRLDVSGLQRLEYQENFAQRLQQGGSWPSQLAKIAGLELSEID